MRCGLTAAHEGLVLFYGNKFRLKLDVTFYINSRNPWTRVRNGAKAPSL